MAEEKKKEGDGKADGGKKKKGLPPILMIAIGAIVGGAGVVFAVPPKTKEVQVAEKKHVILDVTNPDPIVHQFNPRSDRGRATGSVSFKFVYTVEDDLEGAAYDKIKQNWEEANSRALDVLTNRSIAELQTDPGVRMLEKDLIDELDRTIFTPRNGEERIARVTRVLWQKRLFQ